MSVLDIAVELVAHLEGVTAPQLAEIEAALPSTKKLIDLSVQAKPLLVKAGPMFDELILLYDQAKPMIAEAVAEWQQVGPALSIIVGILSKKTAAGATLTEAAADIADQYTPQPEI